MTILGTIEVSAIFDGLLTYVCLLVLLTFHEFAHAWTAWKCGDDTAHRLGRVSLNPAVHIDPIGTVVLPLLVVFLSAADSVLASFIIGWGKPVPVNPSNLRRRRLDDVLISMAGPAMNFVLAFLAVVLARGFEAAGSESFADLAVRMALISLVLCFFNLLPIPPLDGSHVVKHLIGMSDETYLRLCQFGFIAVILVIQLPPVRAALKLATVYSFNSFARVVGLG